MKYLIINDKRKLKRIINYLIDKESLPKVQRRLNIFASDDSYQVEVLNNVISYRTKNRSKSIFVKNKNFKYFLKMLNNNIDCYINDISFLKFIDCSILFNTFHGTIIEFDEDPNCYYLKNEFNLEIYENINDHKYIIKPKPEKLFDEIGNLNSKIKNYGIKTGLDIRSTSSSLKLRLSNISNDYSFLEQYFGYITNEDMLSTKSLKRKYNISNMSIIIPVFNQNVKYTLLSIQGQNLSKDDKKKLQVILIDDGSVNNMIEDIKDIRNLLDYELDIISFEHNMGLSAARNVGYSIAKYDNIVFLDSDIVLSKNYIYDMNIRIQLIPNAIFTCMRKNIEKTSEILRQENLLAGVESCTDLDDSRITTKGKSYHIGGDRSYVDEEISILDDTDNFKELSFGSQIEIYNISTVVAGHNIVINKLQNVSHAPFSTKFKGWGLEDAYFAARQVSKGCFVIPVLSSCVYHINHPPRSGSSAKKKQEANLNYKLYTKLLNESWEE